jgi:lipopolysaccharide/colanic/teichoic acid biosynthesis glycosyltransferase
VRTSADVPWINCSKLDLFGAAIAPLLALALRDVSLFDEDHLSASLVYAGVGAVLGASTLLAFGVTHTASRFFSIDDALTVLKASAIAVFATVAVCFLWYRLDSLPRTVPLLHFALLGGGNIAGRSLRYFSRRRRRRPRSSGATENLIVIGATDLAWHYIQMIENLAGDRFRIVALLDDEKKLQGRYVHGYPVASIRNVESVLKEYEIHGVDIHRFVFAVDLAALDPKSVEEISRVAGMLQIELDLLTERLGIAGRSVHVAPTPESKSEAAWLFWSSKRIFDIVVAGAILLVSLPLAILICLLLLIDCGYPVIFWQVRVGRYGRKLVVYKFRTLKAPYTSNGTPISEDKRISSFRRLLRAAHLDEWPQLVSILVGDMSLIGPRPLLPIDLSESADLRLSVRPGITGWAQVNGATLLSPAEKNAMDEWYIRHASWSVDFAVMAATVRPFFGRNQRNESAIADALREEGERQSSAPGTIAETPKRPVALHDLSQRRKTTEADEEPANYARHSG